MLLDAEAVRLVQSAANARAKCKEGEAESVRERNLPATGVARDGDVDVDAGEVAESAEACELLGVTARIKRAHAATGEGRQMASNPSLFERFATGYDLVFGRSGGEPMQQLPPPPPSVLRVFLVREAARSRRRPLP